MELKKPPSSSRFEDSPAGPGNTGLNWKTWRWETIGSYVFLGVVLIVSVIVLGEEFKDHVTLVENWLAAHGYWALIIAVALYALLSALLVPDTLLGLVAGASFGFTWGIIIAVVASLIAAIAEYLLARRLLKPTIDRHLSNRPAMKAIQKAVITQEFKLQFLIRLTPINRAVTSYILGASGVRFASFIAAAVGFLPHLVLEVYFGFAGRHLALISGHAQNAVVLHEVLLITGLLVTIIAIFLISRTAKRAVESVVERQIDV